jgi:hypothetical protein
VWNICGIILTGKSSLLVGKLVPMLLSPQQRLEELPWVRNEVFAITS